ncbi:HAD family hydrolase [soil metagenome]
MKRLVLFDIDETMISSNGAGRKAMARALKESHDIPEEATRISMSGKTDPQIMREIFASQGLDFGEEASAAVKINQLIDLYLTYLDQELSASQTMIMHEGVVQILDRLRSDSNCYLGLLTGNVEIGARKKLHFFDLNHYFEIGAYGSDSANRLDLPQFAVKRAQDHFSNQFAPEEVIIVGDSVNDIACAHGYGAQVIAVNTGKTPWKDLEERNPQHLFKNLADTEAVYKAIFK